MCFGLLGALHTHSLYALQVRAVTMTQQAYHLWLTACSRRSSSLPVLLRIDGARNVDTCLGLQGFLVHNTFGGGTGLWSQVYASGTFVHQVREPFGTWLHGVDLSRNCDGCRETVHFCVRAFLA